MTAYEAYVSVNITPQRDRIDGSGIDHGNLMFSRKFVLSGANFTELAPKIDAIYDAIATLADVQEVPK